MSAAPERNIPLLTKVSDIFIDFHPLPKTLSPRAYCLNALFYLYQTKSILKSTLSHWISTFYCSLETRFHNKIWIFANLPFFFEHLNFEDHWCRAQGLSKNVSNVLDLYHNKKKKGGANLSPSPRQPANQTSG